jgi:hypothetical protein
MVYRSNDHLLRQQLLDDGGAWVVACRRCPRHRTQARRPQATGDQADADRSQACCYRTRQAPAKGKVQPAANGADDKARMRLAAQVVQLREEKRLSC